MGGLLGLSWNVLEGSGAVLEPSWVGLGGLEGHLDAVFGPSRPVRGRLDTVGGVWERFFGGSGLSWDPPGAPVPPCAGVVPGPGQGASSPGMYIYIYIYIHTI